MKGLVTKIAITMLTAALVCPITDARGRKDYDNGRNKTEHHQPKHSDRHHGNSDKRPDFGHDFKHDKKHDKKHDYDYFRPGNNKHHHDMRPGNNRPSHSQWEHGNHYKPMRPGHHHHHFNPGPPPPRPMMPRHRHWHRPTPPPYFRPSPGWRPFTTILGVTLGSAINISINALINSGYNVSGYGNDAVYISNVPMLNMTWPDATLYYNNGGLYASEFVYSTPGYNTNRYYNTYNMLVINYGAQYNVSNANGVLNSTWWGSNNQFIRLTFQSGIAGNGSTRFFTTLSFGN